MSHTVLARKVSAIRLRVARIRELLPPDVDAFLAGRTEAEALILNLFLALQTCSDLAMRVVADKGLGVPGEARAAFEALARAGLLEQGLARSLAAAVGLRNRIAHEYTKLDLVRVYEAARDNIGELEQFAAAIASAYDL